MNWIEAIVLAIVEGITEFLPVSSTGHMIIASAIMGIKNDPFTKVFEVAIQFGAILSVVVLYFKRFFKSFDFYFKLFVAFIPTAIVGLLLKQHIDELLEKVWVVAAALLLGGIILLFIDKWFEKNETEGTDEVSYKTGFLIGCFQCLAMVPGVSRSAATIIGGLTQKLTRKAAAEFSFFLAVPTMFAATAKSLYDEKDLILESTDKIPLLLLGNIVAFVVAMLAIKFFINILTKYGFKVFGYYRIALGALLLILLLMNVDLAVV
ncbi:undecaprenyl-diphosphate phosphatase [Cytophaga aurantiaca]|uniref:undecaprenyl-diphosphate phosphatase n=1 Tax=Cytophaga aurantiaca TaxID=29530 RepID=UPI00037D2D5F|nr:undecaprenyl-diphosphate phosphatase [Cytophaga aurantiaca]